MNTNILTMIEQAEVEWKPLGEVAVYVRGLTYNKNNESSDGVGYKILRANNITLENNLLNFDDVKVVKFDTKVKETQKLYKNDILISAASGSREHVGKVAFIKSDLDYYFGGFMGVVRCQSNLNSRYVFHLLTSQLFQTYLNEVLNSSTINNLNSKVMSEFKIPIPPLELQKEIVKRLDILTELEATLEAELILRKKQYQYYRDFLLSENELAKVGFEWKSLGEVAEVYSGGTPSKTKDEYWLNGNIPWLKSEVCKDCIVNEATHFITELGLKNSSARYFRKGTVLMAMVGATIFKVGFLNFRATTNQNIVGIQANREVLLDKYVYYWLMNSYEKFISKLSGYNMINLSQIKGFKIPILPLETQAKIVAILDTFDRLTSSISEGLPKEIELRRKQYEYYRELLLGFSQS